MPDQADMFRPDASICARGEIFDGVDCVALPVDSCDIIDVRLGAGCVDEDGDCFPAKCDGPVPPGLRDCEDARADQHPGRVERCDGLDNDCDGRTDEDYALGRPCQACGRDGQYECALRGHLVCSVVAGQSEELLLDERCDRVDQDCDGVIDEGCLQPLPPGPKTAPRWCGDSLIYLANGLPARLDRTTGVSEVLDDQAAAEPACLGDLVVWLRTARCEGGGTTPRRCVGAQLMLHEGGRTRPLSPLGDLGAPVIGPDGVYLHELSGEASTLLRAPFSGLPAEALGPFSDPTALADDGLVARRLLSGRMQVELVGIDSAARMALSSPENADPGRPARDGPLIAWTAGDPPALWVLVEPTAQGAQVGAATGVKPWVVDGQVWWLAPDGLRRFDAASGQVELIAGDTDAAGLWIGPPGRVQLVAEGARFWAAVPPEPFVPVLPDMGLLDMGAPDMDVADGGVDMGLEMRVPDGGVPDMGAPDAALDARADAAAIDGGLDAGAPDQASPDGAP